MCISIFAYSVVVVALLELLCEVWENELVRRIGKEEAKVEVEVENDG